MPHPAAGPPFSRGSGRGRWWLRQAAGKGQRRAPASGRAHPRALLPSGAPLLPGACRSGGVPYPRFPNSPALGQGSVPPAAHAHKEQPDQRGLWSG